MHINGSVVHYLLTQSFGDIACDKTVYRELVDYPILYDEEGDMQGHTVLIPQHELPYAGLRLSKSICLCLSSSSAAAARDAGFSVIHVRDDVRFPVLYNYLQQQFVSLERLDVQLHAYVDTRSSAQALLDACAHATGCPLSLLDEQYRTICEAGAPSEGGVSDRSAAASFSAIEDEGIDLFMASRNYRHMRSNKNVFAAPGSGDLLMKNLFVKGSLEGVVVSRHEGTALSARYVRFFLEYLSGFLEQLHARLGSFGVTTSESDRIRAAIASLLTQEGANPADIHELLLKDGHPEDSRYVVLRIERSFTYEGAEGLGYLKHRLEREWADAYCFSVEDTLFALADIGPSASSASRDVLTEMLITTRDSLSKVGISREFSNMSYLDAARFQASAALLQGSGSDPTFWFYRFTDYALAWLVEHGWGGMPPEYVAHPAIVQLVEHDAAHKTELLRSLDTFLRCRFNATKAADELFVARSTLLNRLDRIAALTGANLEDPNDILYLRLSLMHVIAE